MNPPQNNPNRQHIFFFYSIIFEIIFFFFSFLIDISFFTIFINVIYGHIKF